MLWSKRSGPSAIHHDAEINDICFAGTCKAVQGFGKANFPSLFYIEYLPSLDLLHLVNFIYLLEDDFLLSKNCLCRKKEKTITFSRANDQKEI